jgi:transposase-like protein
LYLRISGRVEEQADGQESAYGRADHWEASNRGDRAGKGLSTAEVVRKLGITEQTYYRWRKEYGGLRLDQAKRLKEIEKENARLKKLVADQALDNAILKEVSSGKF